MTNKNEIPLKNCPFCGGNGTVIAGGDGFYATCDGPNCFCCVGEIYDRDAMPDHEYKSDKECIAAWNTRAAQPQPPVIEGLSDYILKPELPDYIRDVDIIATYGNEPERIARIKSFIETIRLYAQGQTAQPVDLDALKRDLTLNTGIRHDATSPLDAMRMTIDHLASRGMIVTAQQPTEDAQRALDFCDMVLEIGEPDETIIPVWPIETEMALTHPFTVGMVKTIRAALAKKGGLYVAD